jgi:hypothetical protein
MENWSAKLSRRMDNRFDDRRVFPLDVLDRFALTSSSPLQFMNARTQHYSSRLLRLPQAEVFDGFHFGHNAQMMRAILLASAMAITLNGRRARSHLDEAIADAIEAIDAGTIQ